MSDEPEVEDYQTCVEMYEYLAQLYWLALTTGQWEAKWAVMVSLWGVG